MGLHLAKMTPRAREQIRLIRPRSRSPTAFSGSSRARRPCRVQVDSSRFLAPALIENSISVLTWNISAVNNNPFEYWLSYDDQQYIDLMTGVELFLEDPQDHDAPVSSVFTETMFREIKEIMAREQMEGLEDVEAMWRGQDMRLAERCIISEFVQDKTLGAKRLISMPDRVTNTIPVVTRKDTSYQPPPLCRPSVMNNFNGDLSSTGVWWEQWKKFMFQDSFTVRTDFGTEVLRPVEMLTPISRSKYPALTEEEERVSIPLQILCQAIFDCIIVHLMNELSPENTWQTVKSEIYDKLYRNKNRRTTQILVDVYSDVDIMCLQETAAVFKDAFNKSGLPGTHDIILPEKLDGKRNQNSLILLKKSTFLPDTVREVTSDVAECMENNASLADGDLLVIEAFARDQRPYLIASFHGDTNGLMTLPLMAAVEQAARTKFAGHQVILGLDANTKESASDGQQDFYSCIDALKQLGFQTCWGSTPDAKTCRTTCQARTSLQPQLNKAVRFADRIRRSSMDPKDLIVFLAVQFESVDEASMGDGHQPNPVKDNTGCLEYREETNFPTLEFPSDHGIVAVALRPLSR